MNEYIFLNPVKSRVARGSRKVAISPGIKASKLVFLTKNL